MEAVRVVVVVHLGAGAAASAEALAAKEWQVVMAVGMEVREVGQRVALMVEDGLRKRIAPMRCKGSHRPHDWV